jgi:hypothetical protein
LWSQQQWGNPGLIPDQREKHELEAWFIVPDLGVKAYGKKKNM